MLWCRSWYGAFGLSMLVSGPAEAGFIERACVIANRPGTTTTLCRCIDGVAQQTMTRAQRKKASEFFGDPHKAQVVRQSDRKSDEELWENYKKFSEQAVRACG